MMKRIRYIVPALILLHGNARAFEVYFEQNGKWWSHQCQAVSQAGEVMNWIFNTAGEVGTECSFWSDKFQIQMEGKFIAKKPKKSTNEKWLGQIASFFR